MTLSRPSLKTSSMAAASYSRTILHDPLADPAGERFDPVVVGRAPRRPGCRARGGQVRQPLVEDGGDRVQRRLVDRVVPVERHERLLDRAFAQHQDEAGHALVDRDQVDPADVGVARLGRGREAGRRGSPSERRRGQPEPVLAGELDLAELVADHQLLDGRQRHVSAMRLDVEAVARVGRDAPGATCAGGSAGPPPRARRGCCGRSRWTRRGRSARRAPGCRPAWRW